MKNGIQVLILVFLTLVIISGGYCFLLKMEILPVPAFLKGIPVISSYISPESNDEETEFQKAIKENEELKVELSEKDNEIEKLNAEVNALQKTVDENNSLQEAWEEQKLQLQEEINTVKTLRSNKEETYSNLAEYFEVMKANDAAEIMARLNDEDIIGILSSMETESAAAILQDMNKDRAAVISQKMLVPSTI